MSTWAWFLSFTLLSIFIQGLIALFEMAAVSFNKVRLHYYLSLKHRRAVWLRYLIERPSRLFGTTLIGITTALQVGSECSRRWYEAMGLNPDFAPLSQIFLVMVFGEMAPMFAGRRHPERIAIALVPLMIALNHLLTPFIWAFDALSTALHRLMGTSKEVPLYLSREEVKSAFEEREEIEDEWNAVMGRIFLLKNLTAKDIMTPLGAVAMAPIEATLGELKQLLSGRLPEAIPLYQHVRHRVTAIVALRDLIGLQDTDKIAQPSHSPWFVLEEVSVLEILEQFRQNNQSAAIILRTTGQASGLLTLDSILTQIFGKESTPSAKPLLPQLFVERTLSGALLISDFNREFQAHLDDAEGRTLSDLIFIVLEHSPVKGETITIGSFEFTVEELTLMGVKTVSVRSLAN